MTDSSQPLRLAELLCARVCHDLSGVVGALDSSIGFLVGDAADADALPLARDAAADLKARLRLMRAAWGADDSHFPLATFQLLARGMPTYRRLSIDWSALAPACEFSGPFGRVALNLLMLSAECLPQGGVIRIMGAADDLVVQIIGDKATWPSGFAACIAEPVRAAGQLTDPRTLQMPLTVMMAHAAGIPLTLLLSAGAAGIAAPVRLGGG